MKTTLTTVHESTAARTICCAFLLTVLLIAPLPCKAQWQGETNLTSGVMDSYKNDFSNQGIQADGENVHVVYEYATNDTLRVFYRRSFDSGATWGTPLQISTVTAKSFSPCIGISGSSLHAVWETKVDGTTAIWYARSLDTGLHWEEPVRISEGPDSSLIASVAVEGEHVRVVWSKASNGIYEVYLRQSSDAGASWGEEQQLTDTNNRAHNASITSTGDTLYLTWLDHAPGTSEVFFMRSIDGGSSWGSVQRLTASLGCDFPKIAVRGNIVHVSFIYLLGGSNWNVGYLRSTDAGETWERAKQLSFGPSFSWSPTLAIRGEDVFLVWSDYRNGSDGELYGAYSNDEGVAWVTDKAVFLCAGSSFAPSLTTSESALHLLFANDRRGVYDVFHVMNPGGFLTSAHALPEEGVIALEQNDPNPFNPATTIRYRLPAAMSVSVSVYDVLGRQVETLQEGYESAGMHTLQFDGGECASGQYTVVLRTATATLIRQMTLIR